MKSRKLSKHGLPSGRLGRLIIAAVVALAAFLIAAAAYASDGASEPTAVDRLVGEVFAVLIPVVASLVGTVATWVLVKVKKKLDLDISDKKLESWRKAAQRGARRAGEWARNESKKLTDGTRIPGPDVLEVATNFALDVGDEMELPRIARERLMGLIDSELNEMRDKGELSSDKEA